MSKKNFNTCNTYQLQDRKKGMQHGQVMVSYVSHSCRYRILQPFQSSRRYLAKFGNNTMTLGINIPIEKNNGFAIIFTNSALWSLKSQPKSY